MRRYADLVRHQGNEWLFTAAEMSVLAILRGLPLHVHAEGLRGTGKTTVMRAARGILPPIERVRGCPYNCRPDRPHCPQHAAVDREELERVGRELVPMPFLEISASAKLGTVIGSIDLGRALDRENPGAALLPGTVARAHRGILFVDEINRLADMSPELADALLDVMGTKPGRLQIEETGLPRVEMEVSVAVWAASNPDEEPGPLSDIRRQLADRFDLAVHMARPSRKEEVRAILGRDPFAAADAGSPAPARLPDGEAENLRAAAGRPLPEVTGEIREALSEAYVRFSLESLRAVESWQTAARLHALAAGRSVTERDDLLATAPLALTHRVEPAVLGEVVAFLQREQEQPAACLAGRCTAGERAVPAPGPVPAVSSRVPGGGPPAAAGRPARSSPRGAPAVPATQAGGAGAAARSPSWWERLRAKPAGSAPDRPPDRPGGGPPAAGEFAPPRTARPLVRLSEAELVYAPESMPGGDGDRRA